MPEGISGAAWALCWGSVAASGVLGGAVLGLIAPLPHCSIAAIMSFGAGVLLSAASVKVATEALIAAGAIVTAGGIVAGAAMFSIANAALASATDRKRCGECKPQLSEADAPGSGTSIALGTALDAVPEALSGTAGMRSASRSTRYILSLWSGIAVGTAATTALAFWLLSDLSAAVTATLKAFGAGALIAMAAETMITEAFHNGPRYSGFVAAAGFTALTLLSSFVE